MSFEAAGDLELVALEQVGEPRRIHLDEMRPAADLQLQVGAHRPPDLVRERRHFRFQVLVRAHVGAASRGLFRQQIEQVGIDVVADAERVNADSAAVAAIEDLQDFGRLLETDRRQAVGQEHDLKGSPGCFIGPKRRARPRAQQRCRCLRLLRDSSTQASRPARSSGGRPRSSSRNEIGVVANEISAKRSSGPSEPSVCFKAALACRSFSSSMLDDVSTTSTRSRGAGFALSRVAGAEQQQEKASIAGRLAVGQERKADPLGLGDEVELEVLVELAGRFCSKLTMASRSPWRMICHVVARAVDRPERVGHSGCAPPS